MKDGQAASVDPERLGQKANAAASIIENQGTGLCESEGQISSVIKYIAILAEVFADIRSKPGFASTKSGLAGSDIAHAIAISYELLARLSEFPQFSRSRAQSLQAGEIADLVKEVQLDPGGPKSAAILQRQEIRRILEVDQDYWRACDRAVSNKAEDAAPTKERDNAINFDPDRLLYFLKSKFPTEWDLSISAIKVMSLGYSKKTFMIALENASTLPDEIVVRADQKAHHIATTVLNEYPLLQLLSTRKLPVPRPYALEDTGEIIGTPFIVVSREPGDTVGDFFFSPPPNLRLTASTARALARIHDVPLELLRTAGLSVDDDGRIEREFEVFRHTWHDLTDECPTIDLSFVWLKEHLELAHGLKTLVHYDFCYNNLLVKDDEVTSILDWEFAHIGNPAADLGYCRYAADRMSGFDAFKREYAKAGRPLPPDEQIDFYYVWGLTRFAVMLFQAKRKFETDLKGEMRWGLAPVYYLRRPILAIGEKLDALLSKAAPRSETLDARPHPRGSAPPRG